MKFLPWRYETIGVRPRILVVLLMGSALISGGTLHAQRAQSPGLSPLTAIPTFELTRGADHSSEKKPVVSIESLNEIEVDLGALGIRPTAAPPALDPSQPMTTAVGKGFATLGITHNVVNQSTPSAFGVVSSGWSPAESVEFRLNGVVVLTAASNGEGRLAVNVSTAAGFGYLLIEEVGLTSGKRAAGVVQVSDTGPYVPGVATAPHAVNTSAGGTFFFYGFGYPPSTTTTVNLYRNGTFIGNAATSAAGRFFVTITPANNGDTGAVYSADRNDVPANSLAGVSVEERSDAGPAPVGDQNSARMFFDRSGLTSTGGSFALVGEGFWKGESVALSSCGTASFGVDANGAVNAVGSYSPGTAVFTCVLTGGTSGRVARGSVQASPNAAIVRGLITGPAIVGPGGSVTVLLQRSIGNDVHNVYLDGALIGTTSTNAGGNSTFSMPKPIANFPHAIGVASSTGVAQATVVMLRAARRGDVDRDQRTDRTVFRPSNGVWYSALSGGGATITGWGVAGDVDVQGDYDGDGKADIAAWRPSSGDWLIVYSSDSSVHVVTWGTSGDTPLAGDFDGDGKDDLAIFRPSAGAWFVNLSGGGTSTIGWGVNGDYPLLGDFDGDGLMDVVNYRPSSGVWYVKLSTGGSSTVGWGIGGDIPVAGDWDGDGRSDQAVFRPSSGQWLINKSSGGILAATWGTSIDTPVSGDWDGDGRSDFTVWRDTDGVWYTQYATGGSAVVGWGISGDKPTGRRPGS